MEEACKIVYDTRTGHKTIEETACEKASTVLKRMALWFCKSAWHWRMGFWEGKLLAGARTVWLAPGNCMYRYPSADEKSKGAFHSY
jgi:hypothetical protein